MELIERLIQMKADSIAKTYNFVRDYYCFSRSPNATVYVYAR